MDNPNKVLNDLKKGIKDDIASSLGHTYRVAQYTNENNKKFFAIFNDKWPSKDEALVNPDPEGRRIVRSYGLSFARTLVIYRDALNEIFKVNDTSLSIHTNKDVLVYNRFYRVKFTFSIDAIPIQYNSVN